MAQQNNNDSSNGGSVFHKLFLLLIIPIALGLILLTSSYLLRKEAHPHQFHYIFRGVEPEELWRFFADFENQLRINPTMISYQLLHTTATTAVVKEEESQADAAEDIIPGPKSSPFTTKSPAPTPPPPASYSVRYQEFLVNLPFIKIELIGNYSVSLERSSEDGAVQYLISSNHSTCSSVLTAYSTNDLKISAGTEPKTTELRQLIQYDCPWLLTKFCQAEFIGQRKLIQGEMRKIFKYEISNVVEY